METTVIERIDKYAMLETVQLLHQVQRRLGNLGYRPVAPTDRLKLGQTLLRVEVEEYGLRAKASDALGVAPGTRFLHMRKDHLTEEGRARLNRSEFDPENPKYNEVRWFVKNEAFKR